MVGGPLALELIVVLVGSAVLLHRYGDYRKQHPIVTVSTFIGWFFSFTIVFILPLDVALTFYDQCLLEKMPAPVITNGTSPPIVPTPSSLVRLPPTGSQTSDANNSNDLPVAEDYPFEEICSRPRSYVPPDVLPSFWRVIYWTSQCLTWIILPLMQSYSMAGEFSAVGKLRTALKMNALYYGSYLLLFGVMLIYVAASGQSLNFSTLKVICITASNTWGLFLLVLLLGYGLVEVPRRTWQSSLKGYSMQKTYFELEKLSSERHDAEEALREAYLDTKAAVDSLKDTHPLSAHAAMVMAKFPENSFQNSRRSADPRGYRDSEAANIPTISFLVRLHKRVIDALHTHHRTQAQWQALMASALYLEDVVKNEGNANKQFVHTIPPERNLVTEFVCSPGVEWYWQCLIKRPILKVLAGAMIVLSVFIVWSEVTFFNKNPVLSLAAVFVQLAARNYAYAYIELSSVITIAYLCVCAYYTVFKLKIYRYYHLDSHHQTDANSLLFSAIMLSRLTPPLCLNFLGIIHLDSHVADEAHSETAYTKIMGHMDVIGFIANGFNIYFPMAILALCLGTYFRLGTRVLHFMGFDQFMEDDEMTVELLHCGKALVQTERNRIQREKNREARNEFWQEKLGDHDMSRSLRRDVNRSSGLEPTSGEQSSQRIDSFPSERSKKMTSSGRHVTDVTDKSNIMENAEAIAIDEDIDNQFLAGGGSGGAMSRSSSRNLNYGTRDANRGGLGGRDGIFDDL